MAESLRMKGELEFTRLLRVDGRFEGELITDKGSLVVGPKGEVIGDLKNMQVSQREGDGFMSVSTCVHRVRRTLATYCTWWEYVCCPPCYTSCCLCVGHIIHAQLAFQKNIIILSSSSRTPAQGARHR